MVRWVYIARFTLAASIFTAAVFVWQRAFAEDTLVASLAFAGAMLATVGSAFYTEVRRRPVSNGFLYAQAVFDVLLITAVVHVTGGGASQFAALSILVIAAAALLLPSRGVMLVALLGCAAYFGDVFLFYYPARNLGLILQLMVFGIVAIGSAAIGARLREAGTGKAQELAAELAQARLQAADVLENIRSGILTVDEEGRLLDELAAVLAHPLGRPRLAPGRGRQRRIAGPRLARIEP